MADMPVIHAADGVATVSLDGYGIGGYVWKVAKPDTTLVIDETISAASSPDRVGGGSTVTYRIRLPKDMGSAVVTFDYQRAWEPNAARSQSYRIVRE